MTRFFFDTFDGQEWIRDNDGVECGSGEIAVQEAQDTLPDIVREELPDGRAPTIWVRIRDEANQVVGVVSLSMNANGSGNGGYGRA